MYSRTSNTTIPLIMGRVINRHLSKDKNSHKRPVDLKRKKVTATNDQEIQIKK